MIIDRGNFLQNNFVPVYNRPNNAMLTYHGTSLYVTKAWQKICLIPRKDWPGRGQIWSGRGQEGVGPLQFHNVLAPKCFFLGVFKALCVYFNP